MWWRGCGRVIKYDFDEEAGVVVPGCLSFSHLCFTSSILFVSCLRYFT